MNYLDEVEQELVKIITGSDSAQDIEWGRQIIGFVRAKLLESYKNGLAAGRSGKQKQLNTKSKNSKAVE